MNTVPTYCGSRSFLAGYFNDGTNSMTYHQGKYKALVQEDVPIEFPDCIGYRLQYEVNPNPIKSGEAVLVKIKNNFTGKRVNVSIYNMQSVMIYNNQFTENVIEIKQVCHPVFIP